MLFLYLSPAWLDEARRRLDADPIFRTLTVGLSGRIVTQLRDAPEGTPAVLVHDFTAGRLKSLEAAATAPPAALTIKGDYDTFVKLQKGEINLRQAYFNGLIRLEGDSQKAMRFAPAFFKYQEILASVGTVY